MSCSPCSGLDVCSDHLLCRAHALTTSLLATSHNMQHHPPPRLPTQSFNTLQPNRQLAQPHAKRVLSPQCCRAPGLAGVQKFWAHMSAYARLKGVPLATLLATGGLRAAPSRVVERRPGPSGLMADFLDTLAGALHPRRAERMALGDLLARLRALQVLLCCAPVTINEAQARE
jgi:hypothetical protein